MNNPPTCPECKSALLTNGDKYWCGNAKCGFLTDMTQRCLFCKQPLSFDASAGMKWCDTRFCQNYRSPITVSIYQKKAMTGIPAKNYVRLINGTKFYLDNPSKTKGLRLIDLITPIAEISRFNFHLPMHYSVAEHQVYCSYRCSSPIFGLIHDLAEAIITDLPAPVKALCPDYKRVELRVEKFVYGVFGLKIEDIPSDLKYVDKRVLASEELHFGRPIEDPERFPPYGDLKIGCWKPVYAVLRYFERLQELTNNKYTLDTILEMPEQPDSYFESIKGIETNAKSVNWQH